MATAIENHEELFREILRSYAEAQNDPVDEYVDGDGDFEYYSLLELDSFGEFENVELDDGSEGHGEDCYWVFKEDCYWVFKWKGEYYKFCYTWQSYNGCDYDDGSLFKVEPKEKMITVYEPI